jgi:Mg2+ and Co2+ transporter CorA
MKVKIAYSVDVDSIPDKVIEILQDNISLLEKVRDKVDDCCTVVSLNTSPEKYKVALEIVHNMRTNLAMFDQILGDAGMVLDGFHKMKTEVPPTPAQATVKSNMKEIKKHTSTVETGEPDAS